MNYRRPPAMVWRLPSARVAWRELWALLEKANIAKDIYAPMVAIMAVDLGLAEDSSLAIFHPMIDDMPRDEKGRPVRRNQSIEEYLKGKNSQTMPELTLLRDSLKHAARIGSEFGMSPASEARIGVGEPNPAKSPLLDYMRQANERMRRQRKGA